MDGDLAAPPPPRMSQEMQPRDAVNALSQRVMRRVLCFPRFDIENTDEQT
jgi:hypothetical protein